MSPRGSERDFSDTHAMARDLVHTEDLPSLPYLLPAEIKNAPNKQVYIFRDLSHCEILEK
jgi:hypothetical protein